jgi:hypothetical protein
MIGFRRSRRLALGLVLTSLTLTAQVVVGATAAEARCAGVGRAFTSTLGAGYVIVTERPVYGDCDGNNKYTGRVRRESTIAQYVEVWIQNGGIWSPEARTNSTEFVPYSFTDNNSNTFMTLCWYDYSGQAGVPHCGWGTNYGPVGTTPRTRPDIYNGASLHGVNFGF